MTFLDITASDYNANDMFLYDVINSLHKANKY